MKKNIAMMAVGLVSIGLSSVPSFAGVTHALGHWEGSGASYGVDGKEQGQFLVALDNTSPDGQSVVTNGTVTSPNGQVTNFSQKMRDTGDNSFSIQTDSGKGGGYCFGQGICELYIATDATHGVAVTLAFDGAGSNEYRAMITELENGRATGFQREKLKRSE